MKLTFHYSEVYFRQLNKYKSVEMEWETVVKLGKKFERRYASEIEKITKIIPELTGKGWRKKDIDVYMVKWPGPSFSNPLTLNVKEDLLLTLVILVHELLHDFYVGEDKKIEVIENKINNLVDLVFNELGIDAKEQINVMLEYHRKRYGKK